MDKGIRPACNAKFRELLPQRAALGNTAFRKAVMDSIREDFGCSVASAATHYNHSFKEVKKTDPTLVEGLGRPEDKKGGRKKKETAVADPAAVVEGGAAEAAPLLLTYTPAKVLYTVVKAKDGTVVAKDLTQEEATALIEKAAKAKKGRLQWEQQD